MGDLRQRLDVADGQQRVGRRLDPDQTRAARTDRGAYGVDVTDGRRAVLEPPRLRDLVEQPERPAVGVVGDDGVVSRPRQPAQDGVLRREPAREGEATLPLLEGRERSLERRPRRVRRAAVLVSAAEPADAVLLVGAGRVDRRDHRTGGRVGLVAGMDGAGVEPRLAAMVLSHASSVVVRRPPPADASGFRHIWRERTRARRCCTLWTSHPGTPEGATVSIFSRHKTTLPTAEEALPGRATSQFVIAPKHRVLDAPVVTPTAPEGYEVAIFGLGCFWGAEEIYWQKPGVWSTSVGYAGGTTPNPSYEEVCSGRTGHTEAVRIVFDPSVRSPTPTWSRPSSRSTTRPRACARATTSAPSTARRSTTRRPSRSRRLASSPRSTVTSCARRRLRRHHHRDPARVGDAVLLRRGPPPAVPRQEPLRLPLPRERRRTVPGGRLTTGRRTLRAPCRIRRLAVRGVEVEADTGSARETRSRHDRVPHLLQPAVGGRPHRGVVPRARTARHGGRGRDEGRRRATCSPVGWWRRSRRPSAPTRPAAR